MQYLMLYARYDPDNYLGHRKVALKATTMADAEVEAQELLERSHIKGPWEYQILEYTKNTGPKIWPR